MHLHIPKQQDILFHFRVIKDRIIQAYFFHVFPECSKKATINRIFLIISFENEDRKILFSFP